MHMGEEVELQHDRIVPDISSNNSNDDSASTSALKEIPSSSKPTRIVPSLLP